MRTLSFSIICLLAVACSQSFAGQDTLQREANRVVATCCIPAETPHGVAAGIRTGDPPQPGDLLEQLSAESIISQHKNSTGKTSAWRTSRPS